MSTTFTPGPWTAAEGPHVIRGPKRVVVAKTTDSHEPPETKAANAALIAAAPAMYEALKNLYEIVDWLQQSGNTKSPIEPHPYGLAVIQAKQDARSAIKLAEGGTK